jgi:hypothetical protein
MRLDSRRITAFARGAGAPHSRPRHTLNGRLLKAAFPEPVRPRNDWIPIGKPIGAARRLEYIARTRRVCLTSLRVGRWGGALVLLAVTTTAYTSHPP